jgi:hypothetical protein
VREIRRVDHARGNGDGHRDGDAVLDGSALRLREAIAKHIDRRHKLPGPREHVSAHVDPVQKNGVRAKRNAQLYSALDIVHVLAGDHTGQNESAPMTLDRRDTLQNTVKDLATRDPIVQRTVGAEQRDLEDRPDRELP